MPGVERTVTVDKPLDTVWAYLSDFRTTEEWDTLTFAATPSGGTAVTYRAEFSPHGAAKLAEPLMPMGVKVLADKVAAGMQGSLEKL